MARAASNAAPYAGSMSRASLKRRAEPIWIRNSITARAPAAAMALIERTAVVAALRALPDRQREAIVLRYYADFSEADIAATMGISRGAVKSHTARGMTALRSILEQES